MAKQFPQFRYGGERGDYVVGYEVDIYYGNSPLFNNLSDARAFAIEYGYKHPNKLTDSWGNPKPSTPSDHVEIKEVTYVRADGFLQQSGKSRVVGWTLYYPDIDKWIWRDKVKSNSVWMNKNGRGYKKLTRSELNNYVW